MKNKYTIIGIIATTIVLAGVAIYTAIRLYQTRQTAVAPNVPSSQPRAANPACSMSFTLSEGSSTPTATSTATATATGTATATSTSTATATATATSNPQCNNNCSENTDCPNGLMCYKTSGATTGSCRNTSCLTETDCLCPVPTSTATSQPELPSVGTTWPTIVGTVFGILVILGSLLLAF